MLRKLPLWLVIFSLLSSISVADMGYSRCNCDDEGSLWSTDSILECQRVSDFLIAVAYFSIPVELLYFVSCSNVPFKWVLFQFCAFIVLCGLTHLLNGWTFFHHTFQVMLALTIFKILTALVSCATAITLITLIPLLLKVKVREFMLRKKAWDLDREVGIIMKQKEAGLHVRMLTQEIRKSLDRHTILYTTLVELSKTLGLQNCAVWMPDEGKTRMKLTHELKGRRHSDRCNLFIPVDDPDIEKIKGSDEVNILMPNSALAAASSGELREPGLLAAIRMPMLQFSNFKGGTPELIEACYAVLVLVLPGGQPRSWTNQELEIIKVVADQVAVALSHAAVLEESQLMREKLEEQNRALQQAKKSALMASQARNSFQKSMNDGLRRPMHTISGLLSILQDKTLSWEQTTIVDAMARTSIVLSTLINDVMDISTKDSGRFPLEIKSFRLHSMIREAACLFKCLCIYKGSDFAVEIDKTLPDFVIGDNKRVFQVLLHMIGNLLNDSNQGGLVTLQIFSEIGSQESNDQKWVSWKSNPSDGELSVRFEVGISTSISKPEFLASIVQLGGRRYNSDGVEESLSFCICKRLVQLMQGNIWVAPNSHGFAQSMTLSLHFLLPQPISAIITEAGGSSEYPYIFRGLKILLVENDNENRIVTKKLLEKLGCKVSAVASGLECLSSISHAGSLFQIVLLDLHMPEMDIFEFVARIRKFRAHNWPLLIALTTSGDEDVWERCLEIGYNGVITKPAFLTAIANELRRVLFQENQAMR